MPTARWHQGADFAHQVPSKTRFAQPPAIDRTLPRSALRTGSPPTSVAPGVAK